MLVLDASALLTVLLGSGQGALVERLADERELHVPHLIDVEVASALRRLCHAGHLGGDRARDALTDLSDLKLTRYPHEPLLPRVWELRENLSAYDATYVALAELLGSPLLTTDAGLARSPGNEADIELVA